MTDRHRHEAPDVNLSDLPKVPTGPGPGQPEGVVLMSATALRIEKVLALHTKVESISGAGPWCNADGCDWPCETVKILTGEADAD